MRYLAALFATFVLAACSKTPVTRNESQDVSPTQAIAPEMQKASMDSVVQFLLTAAATDFHTHRPADPVRFRDVRIGHVMTPSGDHAAKQAHAADEPRAVSLCRASVVTRGSLRMRNASG